MKEATYLKKIRRLAPVGTRESSSALVMRLAEQALDEHPHSARLLCLFGDLIQLSGGRSRYASVDPLKYYRAAIESDPEYWEPYESIGYYLLVYGGKLRVAEGAFRNAIRLGAGDDSILGLAEALLRRGKPAPAMATILRCANRKDARAKELAFKIVHDLQDRRSRKGRIVERPVQK